MIKLTPFIESDKEIIHELYNKSFPPAERRPFEELFNKYPSNNFFEIYNDDSFVGIITSMTFEKVTFITYFAIKEEFQSHGFGSDTLKLFKQKFEGNTFIADLEYCKKTDRGIKWQRKNFYIKNGFYQTTIDYKWKGVRYQIFSTDLNYDDKQFDLFWDNFSKERK